MKEYVQETGVQEDEEACRQRYLKAYEKQAQKDRESPQDKWVPCKMDLWPNSVCCECGGNIPRHHRGSTQTSATCARCLTACYQREMAELASSACGYKFEPRDSDFYQDNRNDNVTRAYEEWL